MNKALINRSLVLHGLDENITCLRRQAGDSRIANLAVNMVQSTRDFVAAQPVVDAVPVVRCKDCVHRHTRPTCAGRHPDWFCADGIRRSYNE